MDKLLGLLALIGITTARSPAAVRAFVALIQKTSRYWGRTSWIEKQITGWIVAGLAGLTAGWEQIQDGVLKWLGDMIGEPLSEFSKEEFIRAAGIIGAREINKQLLKRYGVVSPIETVTSPALPEELGLWFAQLTNEKLSELMGKDVELVSTFFPIDNIAPEVDSFLSNELNMRLGTNINSVLFNNDLLNEIQRAIVTRLENEIVSQVAHAKGVAIEQITSKAGISMEDKADLMRTYSDVMDTVLNSLNFFNLIGVNTSLRSTYQKNKVRIHNRARQREYRRTHREVRHWEVRT